MSKKYKAILPADKIVEDWYINGKNRHNTFSYLKYRVKKEDADSSGVINISYTTKTPVKVILKFDGTKIDCEKGSYGGEGTVTSGTEVKEGYGYYFKAKLPADKIVEDWYINGTNKYNTFPFLSYRVKKEDVDSSGVIEISYTAKTPAKALFIFDGTKIKCEKGYFGGDGTVTSGTEVKEGDRYCFKAILNAGESVKNWTINGTDKYATNTTYNYRVNKDDIDSDGKINVDFVKN